MAGKQVLLNTSVVVNSTVLTTRARSVDIDTSSAELPATAFGGDGWEEVEPGLMSGTIAVEFFNDFGAGSVYATLWPLAIARTGFTVRIGPNTDVAGATNPVFEAPVKLFNFKFLAGEVGTLSMNPVTMRLTAAPTIDITP